MLSPRSNLKNHLSCQKFGKKWRKSLFNSSSTHFSLWHFQKKRETQVSGTRSITKCWWWETSLDLSILSAIELNIYIQMTLLAENILLKFEFRVVGVIACHDHRKQVPWKVNEAKQYFIGFISQFYHVMVNENTTNNKITIAD